MRKFTLITGASSGIGVETAKKLALYSDLILWGQNLERLKKVKEACVAEREKYNNCNYVEPLIINHDLNKICEIKDALSLVLANYSGVNQIAVVDKFVHCAGICAIAGVKNYKFEQLTEMMNINVFSAMEIVKHLVRKKINNKALENVVFISSTYAKHGKEGHSFYGASKGALNSYMKSMAKELAPDVKCNSILPGAVKTAMSENFFADQKLVDKELKNYPLGFGETIDVANMIEFLLSDEARWITGQEFIVDGGFSI